MTKEEWSDAESAYERLKEKTAKSSYLGFYSSFLGGFFKEPWVVQIPIDDHGFHRGDGVFEAIRISGRAYFDLNAHLNRLYRSADAVGLKISQEPRELGETCLKLARLCRADEALLRLYVTRGPGSFSPNPFESSGSQIYMAMTPLKIPSSEVYRRGTKVLLSSVGIKDPFWSRIKSLNYLPNVLLKKEAIEKGFDHGLSVDSSGRIAEGATENFLLITKDNELIVPRFDYTLRGTTVQVVMELAKELLKSGRLKSVGFGDLYKEDLLGAQELAFVGTTIGVLPITSVDGQPIGSGQAGEVCQNLNVLLQKAILTDSNLRTPF